MKGLSAAVSIIAQLAGFLALGWMFYDLFTLPEALLESAGGDTELLQQYIVETVVSYQPGIGIGALGAIATWLLILKGRFHASWFLKNSAGACLALDAAGAHRHDTRRACAKRALCCA